MPKLVKWDIFNQKLYLEVDGYSRIRYCDGKFFDESTGDELILSRKPTKDEVMKESKRYAILVSDMVKYVYLQKEEAEKQAAKFADENRGRKYYVAEIYCFYQTREPVQRVDLV